MAGIREHGREPPVSKNVGSFLTSLELISFSRNTLLHGLSYVVFLVYKIIIVYYD